MNQPFQPTQARAWSLDILQCVKTLWGRLETCGRLAIGRFFFEKHPSENPLTSVSAFRIRRLPHFHEVGRPMFITWRLHGSLPPQRAFPESISSGRVFLILDRLLHDARTGPLYLQRPEIAALVVDAIRYRHPSQYDLHHFVVMPNHVHLLVTPHIPISKVMHSLKRFTAREANKVIGLTGQSFWQDESYDRLIRDGVEFDRIANYIERNPVDAGIVNEPQQFQWSSAWPIANRPQVSNLPHSS